MLVDIDRLNQLGAELRNAVPAGMQEASEVVKQKESIVKQAYLEAQRIKEAATVESAAVTAAAHLEHESKVEESDIVRSAMRRAQQIHEQAMAEAAQISQDSQKRGYQIREEAEAAASMRREGADQYAREVLFHLEEQFSDVLGQVRRGIDALGVEAEGKVPA